MTLASFGTSLLGYVFNLIVARFFPLDIYGELMAAMVYLGLLTVPFGAVNVLLIRRVGLTSIKERQSLIGAIEDWVSELVRKRFFVLLFVLLAVFFLIVTQTNLRVESAIWILLMTIVSLATILYSASLQAFKSFIASGSLNIITTLFKIVAGCLVLWLMPSLGTLYGAMILASVAAFFVARKLVRKKSDRLKTFVYKLASPFSFLTKRSILIPTLATVGMVGILSLDVMVVKRFFSPDQAGLYAALSLLSKIVLYISAPLATVAYTFFTGSDTKQDGSKILLTTSLLVLFGGLILFLAYYLAPELIVTLIFGQKFLSIAPQAYLAAIFGVSYSLAYLFNQYLISKNHPASMWSAIVMVIQVLALITFHETFAQVLYIGIGATTLLNLISLASIIKIPLLKNRF